MNKATLAVAGIALATSMSAVATPVTVAGITWDPDAFLDFSSQNTLFVNDLTNVGDVATGTGKVTNINGGSNFGTNELTYQFGGYQIATLTGNNATFIGGWVNFYSDASNNFDFQNAGTATDGSLFLSLVARNTGSSTLTGTLATLNQDGNAQGVLDVVGGLASTYFDTNSMFSGGDLEFTASWNKFPNGGTTPDGFSHLGTTEMIGNTVNVPEPASLALLALGLGLIGVSRIRSK